ncbi:MAG: hypothetical protein KAS32_09880 [Candidatus Peribacteraceae bacterium]|nr:hypothetical protein [Candidatus Peribacteraceae bacterium]
MTITVGTDTYISVADADTYVGLNYLATEAKSIAWNALDTAGKEVVLRRATSSIEAISVPGYKYDPDQTLNFPREDTALTPHRRNNYLYYYGGAGEVPQAVKDAEVEEALESASPSTDSKQFDAANSVLKSFRISKKSETYKDTAASKHAGTAKFLKSIKAQTLMSRYVAGSFLVR